MKAHVQRFFDAIAVVAVEEAIHLLRLVATEEVNVALHHVGRSACLLPAGLPGGGGGGHRERKTRRRKIA